MCRIDDQPVQSCADMIERQTPTLTALKPFFIGDVFIETPLTLAPMAGQTNHPFRVLCREKGDCGLVCTELISSKLIESERSQRKFDWTEMEHPFAVQLYGTDPNHMAEAARMVADGGADIVDINMGCWVPKIAKKGGGAALLRDVCVATSIVEAVVDAVDIPVTVKVRSGWDDEHITAVDFAIRAKEAGAQTVAVHARTASQGFQGHANWDIIRQVKGAVRDIPVVGNGDVFDGYDAIRMLEETDCDAVMVGRASLGNPWIFREMAYTLRTGEPAPKPDLHEKAATALRHAQLTIETTSLTEEHAVMELRGQLSKYALDEAGERSIRNLLVRRRSLVEIEDVLRPLL